MCGEEVRERRGRIEREVLLQWHALHYMQKLYVWLVPDAILLQGEINQSATRDRERQRRGRADTWISQQLLYDR